MSIESIEAIPYRLHTKRPVRFANGEVSTAEHVLVRIRTSDGLEGVGEASPRPMTYGDNVGGVVHAIRHIIGPLWIGGDERAPEELHHRLRDLQGNVTARAALDIALFDLMGKRCGVPVSHLLGGFAERVRAAHLLSLAAPDEMAQEAAEVAAEFGVRTFKIKVGKGVEADVARTLAVAEAAGAEATTYLDANHGWSPADALEVLRRLEVRGYRPAWLEEPTPAYEPVGRRWLVERTDVPIVADESAPNVATAAAQLQGGLCQWIALKTGRTGFSRSLRIVGLAEGLGAQVLVGSQIEGALGSVANLHLAAATPATARLPAEVSSGYSFEDDIIDMPAIRDGWMSVPPGPGLGVSVDEERLARLRSD